MSSKCSKNWMMPSPSKIFREIWPFGSNIDFDVQDGERLQPVGEDPDRISRENQRKARYDKRPLAGANIVFGISKRVVSAATTVQRQAGGGLQGNQSATLVP